MSKAPRLTALLAALLLLMGAGLAQTATPAPAPAAAPATPAPAATPATPKAPVRLAVPSNAASALGIEVSGVVKGRLVGCPRTLKLSPNALCLYAQNTAPALRPLIKAKLGARAGDWKMTGQASSLAVTSGKTLALVLLAQISPKETLVVVDTPAPAPAAAQSITKRPVAPAGIIKGEPYLLGSDLRGLANVTALSATQFRLERTGQPPLTVTAGKTGASLGTGTVELPLAPASDGKNLLLPFSALGALGCTATPNGKVLTVACGANSVGVKPIVF
jgi:hypothetical protein